MSIFEYNDYRSYLFDSLGGDKRTGGRQRLAKHVGCQPAYISQVIKGKNNMSLEQGILVSVFFSHSEIESEYFLNLIQMNDSGSKKLQSFFKKRNEQILKTSKNIKDNLKSKSFELNKQDQSLYYSNRLYSLVHVAVSLPSIKSIEDLHLFLKADINELNDIIQFLIKVNIIKKNDNGELSTGPGHTFLTKESPFLKTHHQNLRRHASLKIELDLKNSDDLHYATYYTLSLKDFEKIKRNITEAISKNLEIVEPSKEEVLCCNVIDFFKVI